MARGINKVILVGNLGNDPDMRYMPNGSAVANVSIATSSAWRDKQTSELIERTEWHRIVFFNRLAEIVGEYLRKGSKIYIEGSLRTRKWEDKSGIERYTTEVVANEMQMLDSRSNSGGGNYQENRPQQQQASQQYSPQQQQTAQQTPPAEATVGNNDQFDDDIPF